MFIQTEETPNPATVKFLPGQSVLEGAAVEFTSPDEAARSPLAQRLFGLQGVKSVFFGADFVSVTKAEDTDWTMLKPMVLEALMAHFGAGQPAVLDASVPEKAGDQAEDDEITLQIKALIETRVRPAVMQDGGDIVFERFEDGVVYLHMRGACSGCPSAAITLKSGIENMLRHFVPEVQEVRPAESL